MGRTQTNEYRQVGTEKENYINYNTKLYKLQHLTTFNAQVVELI